MTPYLIILCLLVLSLIYIFFNHAKIKKMSEGTDDMIEMAGIIRSGANTFMATEYKSIIKVLIVVAVILTLFIEKTAGISFIIGGCMSSIVCVLGMRSATYANVRTANKARETLSIGETVKVALCGGSISGLAVQTFGMLGFVLVLLVQGVLEFDQVSLMLDLGLRIGIVQAGIYRLGVEVELLHPKGSTVEV